MAMAGDKMIEEQLKAVWFAAGTAAFIACIERAVVVSLFAHWRVWAFLALNLLLLAILFTSKPQIQSSAGDDSKKRKQDQEYFVPMVSTDDESVKSPKSGGAVECQMKINGEEEEEIISKEELNQRVEAFITRFRQHLVSDHAKSFRPPSRPLGYIN